MRDGRVVQRVGDHLSDREVFEGLRELEEQLLAVGDTVVRLLEDLRVPLARARQFVELPLRLRPHAAVTLAEVARRLDLQLRMIHTNGDSLRAVRRRALVRALRWGRA
jgi:hypothetical protein